MSDKVRVYPSSSTSSHNVFHFITLSNQNQNFFQLKGHISIAMFLLFFMLGSQRWQRAWEGSFCPRFILPQEEAISKETLYTVFRKERTSHSHDQAIKIFIPKSYCQVILQFQLVSYGIYYYMVMITNCASKTSIHKASLGIKNLGL